MSDTKKTFGTKLYRGETPVAHLTNIDPPEIKRDDIEVTDHDSTDGTREFIPGLKDGGEVPIEGHLIPTEATHIGLLSALDEEDPEEWAIEFPTTPKLRITFDGYVNSFKTGAAPIDGVMTFSAKIKVTGKPEIEVDESGGLSALVVTGVDSGALSLAPAFNNTVLEYFVTAAYADATITVKPTAADHTITVNGATVPTDTESGPIALTAEAMTTITIRTQETGKAPVVYTLKVYREGA
jgi:predicted secreted protein